MFNSPALDSKSWLKCAPGGAKLSKDDRHGYLHTNNKTLCATKKKSKFYQQYKYIKHFFMKKECKHKFLGRLS